MKKRNFNGYCRDTKTMKEYYKQLYTKKFDNLVLIDNFLETYSPPKLNQEEIGHLNRLIIKMKLNM